MQQDGVDQVLLDVSITKKSFLLEKQSTKTVLENVHFQVKSDEVVAITGPSGCGKTTLLNIIADLDHDYDGSISLPKTQNNAAPISYVFQNPLLLPWRTVIENLTLAIPSSDDNQDDKLQELDSLLEIMGLEDIKNSFPRHISLGMARRVSLARAFATNAPFLLMDEPFVSLDELTAERLRILLLKIISQRNLGILFVTHNIREALFLADRLVILSHSPATVMEEITLQPAGRGRDHNTIEKLRNQIIEKHPKLIN